MVISEVLKAVRNWALDVPATGQAVDVCSGETLPAIPGVGIRITPIQPVVSHHGIPVFAPAEQLFSVRWVNFGVSGAGVLGVEGKIRLIEALRDQLRTYGRVNSFPDLQPFSGEG